MTSKKKPSKAAAHQRFTEDEVVSSFAKACQQNSLETTHKAFTFQTGESSEASNVSCPASPLAVVGSCALAAAAHSDSVHLLYTHPPT